MSEHLLQIDATNFRFDSEEDDDEDLIKFRLRNEEQVEVHYSKPVSESKYFCDQFRSIKLYSTRSDKSIKSFIQLFEEEKVNIRYEIYRDINIHFVNTSNRINTKYLIISSKKNCFQTWNSVLEF